jgi:hypothetical protein
MSTSLGHSSIFNHENLIRIHHRAQAMRDDNTCSPFERIL